MVERTAPRPSPDTTSAIAAGLVTLGILLWMFFDRGLLVVAALGAFGPGILRELGLLNDQDEFQRQAAHRAGYHAYLIGGIATVLVLSILEWSEGDVGASQEWIRLILLVLWLSWMFSAVLAYWGAQKTTSRILATFGSFWAVFGIASVIGEADGAGNSGQLYLGLMALMLLVVPWFLLAWTAGRWPRATGAMLLGVAGVLLVVFRPFGPSAIPLATQALTTTLLLVPLLACGIALLREKAADDVAATGELP